MNDDKQPITDDVFYIEELDNATHLITVRT